MSPTDTARQPTASKPAVSASGPTTSDALPVGLLTVADMLQGKRSATVADGTTPDGTPFTLGLRPDPSETACYSVVLKVGRETTGYRVWLKPSEDIRTFLLDFVSERLVEGSRITFRRPSAAPQPRHAKSSAYPVAHFKTYGQEQAERLNQERNAADPYKFSAGDGVAWKVYHQVNRGFRVLSLMPESRECVIRQVADTGITVTGGNDDRIADTLVYISDLIRDRRYDAR